MAQQYGKYGPANPTGRWPWGWPVDTMGKPRFGPKGLTCPRCGDTNLLREFSRGICHGSNLAFCAECACAFNLRPMTWAPALSWPSIDDAIDNEYGWGPPTGFADPEAIKNTSSATPRRLCECGAWAIGALDKTPAHVHTPAWTCPAFDDSPPVRAETPDELVQRIRSTKPSRRNP